MEKIKNPFLVYGYAGPEYFCDRVEETRKLIAAMENGRNVTLMSPRRMGKTGLIHNAFYKISQERPDMKCFYMDIFSTNSLSDFTKMLGQTIVGQLDSMSERWLSRISDFFKSCRPVVSADPITGNPSVMLDFVPSNTENTLKELFDYIKESGKECVIAIDEFQQVIRYPEKGTEALLRSYIQFMPNVHFIFSGSKQSMMNDMFSLPNRPFFQSTQKMNIDAIDRQKYYDFAVDKLRGKDISLGEVVFDYFYDMVYGHTWYIQRFLNKIYEECSGEVGVGDVDALVTDIVGEEEYNYQRQYSLLTSNQQKLLKAVAVEQTAAAINSNGFLQKYGLGATSSVNRAMDFLTDNEFVLQSPQGYQVYDRFLGLWLRRHI